MKKELCKMIGELTNERHIPRIYVSDAVHVAGEDADRPRVALSEGSTIPHLQ